MIDKNLNDKIVIKNVSKTYGEKKALNNLNLTINQGMFGLLGRNGAGKTTLMKILVTLHQPTNGNVKLCGIDIKDKNKIRDIIGYLPQDFTMYNNMSVYEVMDYLGVLVGLNKKNRHKKIVELLEKVNLQNNHKTKVKAMSGGMRRRLGIAQALLNDPKVLIVDEPTAGLDPEERIRFRNILSEIAGNRIVILSTHIVGDIEATCENIVVLDKGEIKFSGTVTQLLNLAKGKIYTLEVAKNELEKVKKEHTVTGVLMKGAKVEVRFISETQPYVNAMVGQVNVEDAYMYLMSKKEGDSYVF